MHFSIIFSILNTTEINPLPILYQSEFNMMVYGLVFIMPFFFFKSAPFIEINLERRVGFLIFIIIRRTQAFCENAVYVLSI